MAEFQIVARAYDRMCDSYSTCEGCPINEHGNDIDTCRSRVLKWPCKYENKIIAWAAEHPEPVYPTWAEWLMEHGLVYASDSAYMKRWFVINQSGIEKPIPADIAEKLGIKPKE